MLAAQQLTVSQLAAATNSLMQAAREAGRADSEYSAKLQTPPAGWTVERGLLIDQSQPQRIRFMIPENQALRTRLLAELHDSTTGAHAGRDRMLEEAQKRFHWEGLSADVERYVQTCATCQRDKTSHQLKPGQLMPLPIPEEPCMHWTTDAVSGLPKTKRGHTSIQVYIDRCTKLKRFAATRTTDGSVELADTTLRTIIGPHGMPKSIVSDRDPKITARFWQELQRVLGSEVKLSTAYHPQTDGQSEREIQTLITALRSYVNELSDDWDVFLPALELAFNSKRQASTGASPFYLVYGVEARLPIDCLLDEARPATATSLPAVSDRATRMKKALAAAFSHTELAQARQKRAADQHRRLLSLKVGDQVLLSTEGLQMRSGMHKLTARYVGPFPVVGLVNENAVTLEFPPLLSALHPTVNISRLKLYRDGSALFPDRPQRHPAPPAVDTDSNGDKRYQIERVIAQKGAGIRRQLLVRWLGYAPEDDQWIKRSELVRSAAKAVAVWEALQQLALED
jgi:transposase InsO family protein